MRIPLSSRWLQRQPDERLYGLAREGHERAFDALVQRHRKPLLAYCQRLLTTGGSAEDALQQAFLQAWVALQRGGEVEAVKPWLYRIVHNAAVKALQAPGQDQTELTDALQGADTPHAALALRTEIRQALEEVAALPPLQREALVQTAIVGHSHGEVAGRLGVSEPAVRGLVYRARTTLRAALGAVSPLPLSAWLPRQLDVSGAGGAAIGRTLTKSGAVVLAAGALITAGETAHLNLPTRPRHSTPTIAERASEPSARDAAKSLAPISTTSTSEPGASHPQLSVDARRAGGQPTAAATVPAMSQSTSSTSASRSANNTTVNGGSGVAGGASSPVGVAPNSAGGASSSAGGASSSAGGASSSTGGASSSDEGAASSADAAPNTDGSSQLESPAAPTTPSTGTTSADNTSTDNVASSDSGTTTTTTTTSPEEAPTSSES